MEYLLLVAAAVAFTVVVTLSTREIIFPASEEVQAKAAEIATSQATFEATREPLILPNDTSTPESKCIPGMACASTYCQSDSTRCQQTCGDDGVCGSGVPDCEQCLPKTGYNSSCPLGWVLNSSSPDFNGGNGCFGSCDRKCEIASGECGDCSPICTAPCIPQCIVGASCGSSSYCSIGGESNFTQTKIYDAACNCVDSILLSSSCGIGDVFTNSSCPIGQILIGSCSSTCNNACNETTALCDIGCVAPRCNAFCASLPNFPPACDVNKCDMAPPNPLFYDFSIKSALLFSPFTLFNANASCYNDGTTCKAPRPWSGISGCKVRGNLNGQNLCATIEDWVDYDWNDFSFSTRVFDYLNPYNETLLEVMLDSCDTNSDDQLTLKFNFTKSRNVTFLVNGTTGQGLSPQFVIWPTCNGHVGEIARFLISDLIPSANYPPTWSQAPISVLPQMGENYHFDLLPLLNDDLTPLPLLDLQLVENSNSSVATCSIVASNLSCIGVSNGTTRISVVALDANGSWSAKTLFAVVGLKFNIPSTFSVEEGATNKFDLWPSTYGLLTPYGQMTYSVTSVSNSTVTSCTIQNSREFDCNGLKIGVANVTVRATNSRGFWLSDIIRVNVVPIT